MISGSISRVGWWEWSSPAHNGTDCVRELKNSQETHHRSGPLFLFSPCANIPNITVIKYSSWDSGEREELEGLSKQLL